MIPKVLLVEHETDLLLEFAVRASMVVRSAWIDAAYFQRELENKRQEMNNEANEPRVEDAGVEIWTVTEPSEITRDLDETFDLVIADILFFHPDAPRRSPSQYTGNYVRDLELILEAVGDAEKKCGFDDRAFPVVAYTSLTERGSVAKLSGFYSRLYDIWEKSTAPDTIVWRMSKLAKRLRSGNPGASLARYITTLSCELPWHASVVEMAQGYIRAGTPARQIASLSNPIGKISANFGFTGAGRSLWNVFTEWEPVGMGARLAEWAHVCHAANVFWLGYSILNHDRCGALRGCIAAQISKENSDNTVPLDGTLASNAAWFIAAVFHDSGLGLSELGALLRRQSDAMKNLNPAFSSKVHEAGENLTEECKRSVVIPFTDYLCSAAPLGQVHTIAMSRGDDHGVVAGSLVGTKILIVDKKDSPLIRAISFASCKAMMLHNLIGDGQIVRWEENPLACLLAICDQLQAWDREFDIQGEPVGRKLRVRSADLTAFRVEEGEGKPLVVLAIDYAVPMEAVGNWRAVKKIETDLEDVLLSHPITVIKDRVQGRSPMDLNVSFSFGGIPLTCRIDTRIGS